MKTNILIAVPSHDMVHARFAYCLAQLSAFTMWCMDEKARENVGFGITFSIATIVSRAREELIQAALREGYTHILWLDSDMVFPKEALIHLLKHKLPVVGINYSKRALHEGFTALKRVGTAEDAGEQLVTTDESTGLEEVEAMGFGCLLMRTDALAELPDPVERPWFQEVYLGKGKWMSEDVSFCKLLRESGQRIFVDHDLSLACSHVGAFEYTVETAR